MSTITAHNPIQPYTYNYNQPRQATTQGFSFIVQSHASSVRRWGNAMAWYSIVMGVTLALSIVYLPSSAFVLLGGYYYRESNLALERYARSGEAKDLEEHAACRLSGFYALISATAMMLWMWVITCGIYVAALVVGGIGLAVARS